MPLFATIDDSVLSTVTSWLFTRVMTSPGTMPAFFAGPSFSTLATISPRSFWSPSAEAISGVTG